MTKARNERHEEPDRSLRDLLADESRASETMDPAQKERILRQLESALGLPPEGGGGGVALCADAEDALPRRSGPAKVLSLRIAAVAIAAALPLVATSVLSQPTSAARAPEVVSVAPPESPPSPVVVTAALEGSTPMTELAPPAMLVDEAPRARAAADGARSRARALSVSPAASAPPVKPRLGLAEERALIASLRDALVAGRFDDAARLLREHETSFARGQLVVEREALRIWLLEDSGQSQAASARAKHFHETYPDSVLRSAVERRAK